MPNRSYQVTIKGLCFDEEGRVLLVQEASGLWDLPGGRMEHGEDFHTALKRECAEEMGIECAILDAAPHWAWSARNDDGLWKVVLCFRIVLPHLGFIASDECVALNFADIAAFDSLQTAQQIHPLREYISNPVKSI